MVQTIEMTRTAIIEAPSESFTKPFDDFRAFCGVRMTDDDINVVALRFAASVPIMHILMHEYNVV